MSFDALQQRHYGAILADPAWNFRSYAKCANPASGRHVERHYPTMTLDDIKALPVRDLASPDGCHLFMWVTGPHLASAFEVMNEWGFRYSGVAFTWVKLKRSFNALQLRVLPTMESDLHVGLGFTTRKNAEFCLLARRGNARRVAKDVREIILAPVREHSRKPDEVYGRIERYCAGPYVELFARQQRAGWDQWGNQVDRFEAAA